MSDFHIFNPETDFALGHNRDFYTPGKNVVRFREKLSFLPAVYAKEGDYIIIQETLNKNEDQRPFYELAIRKGLNIIPFYKLRDTLSKKTEKEYNFAPWGWNKDIRRQLHSNGVDESLLPSLDSLDKLRDLSHRKSSILFYKEYGFLSPTISSPLFFEKMGDVETFLNHNSQSCLKAPWSSSGRGIVFSNNMSKEKMLEWAHGVIRSQGGVMAEKGYDRSLDFASEWKIEHHKVSFCGLSLFLSSGRGKYKGNYLISQQEIEGILTETTDWNPEYIEAHREFLTNHVAPFYQGSVGIDMLATGKTINPFVEMNLRNTMGHVAIELYSTISIYPDLVLSKLNPAALSNQIFNPSLL